MFEAEMANLELSIFQQLKKNMGQTVRMYLNWLLALVAFCAGVVFMGVMSLWLVPYLQVKFGYERTTATMVSGAAFMSSGIGSIIIGMISKRLERRKVFLFVGNALFLAFIAFIYVPAASLPIGLVVLLCVVTGFAFSFFSPFVFTICREYNWFFGNTETATAFVNMGLVLSGAAGQFTIGELLDIHYQGRDDAMLSEEGSRLYTVEDFNFALMIVPISLCVMFVASLLLKETHSKNMEYAEPAADKEIDEEIGMHKDKDLKEGSSGSGSGGIKDSFNTNSNESVQLVGLANESEEEVDDYH